MVNFKTSDGIVHAPAPHRDQRTFDGTACGIVVLTGDYTPPLREREQEAICSDERVTCILCLGS